MSIEKDTVVDMLRAQGEHDKALQAESALPRQVDPERDAGLLHNFDINVCDVLDAGRESGGDAAPTL